MISYASARSLQIGPRVVAFCLVIAGAALMPAPMRAERQLPGLAA